MAKTLAITTKGSKGVLAKLATVNAGLQGEVLETAVRVGSQIVEGDARQRAPRDTGKLAGSIKSSTIDSTPGRASASVGTDVFYALFVEFGTSKMSAHPFLRPAVRANRGRVRTAVRSVISRLLRSRAGL